MTIFRWIVGSLAALLAAGAVLTFVVYILANRIVWLERARRWRHLLWLVLLLWFNVEVWGSVLYTLIHWVV